MRARSNTILYRKNEEQIEAHLKSNTDKILLVDKARQMGKGFRDYQNEFDYLISSGITLGVQAISKPVFPLIQSSSKNLMKLYLNDVGLLSAILYGNNITAILNDEKSINLGSVYESVMASELHAHVHRLFYYDRRGKGEVDFLIDDYETLSVLPIEVKSGKDYTVHSALNTLVTDEAYKLEKAYVLSNKSEIKKKAGITYLPIYFVMFL